MNRRRFACAVAAGALAAGSARGLLASNRLKRVAYLSFMDIEEGDDPKLPGRHVDQHITRPFAAHGLRDGIDLKVVPHIVVLRSKWEETVPRAVREVANGGYDGAIVEGENLTRALRQAAPNLPIAAYLFDPVGGAFARSYAKPGGTVTGAHRGVREIFLKQIDILQRVVPGTTRMAWISFKPQVEVTWPAFEWAARESGIAARQIVIDHRDDFASLPGDFEALVRDGYRCAYFQGALEKSLKAVTAQALRHRIALSFWGHPADFVQEGLLLQYRSLRDGVEARLVAAMAKILRGQRPGDIPFEGPTKYSLRLNLKTAARIGVRVPEDVILMMDEVLR